MAEGEGLRIERKVGGQKTKKVSANNNQPDDQHSSEVGLRDCDASEATARECRRRGELEDGNNKEEVEVMQVTHETEKSTCCWKEKKSKNKRR